MKHRFLSGKFCDILVINTDYNEKAYHEKVPIEHAKMISSSDHLIVKFLKFYKGKSQPYVEGKPYIEPRSEDEIIRGRRWAVVTILKIV